MADLLIDSINFESNIWVVRPGVGYRYTVSFIDGSFIAIGHLDEFDISQETFSEEISYENIGDKIEEYNSIQTRNVKSQIDNFIINMKVGDVVFTLDKRFVIPGVIRSNVFYSNDSISNEEQFHVRRTVEWGEPILKSSIPVTIQRSFTAYQTVFSLNEHSQELYHWLMSFFISGDNYFGSLRIEQPNALKHHTLKQLSELIDRIQVLSILIAKTYEDDPTIVDRGFDITFDQLQNAMATYSDEGLLALTVQQITMSPGDVWLKFTSSSKIAGSVFLYLILTTTSPGKSLEFTDGTYASELEKVQNIAESNRHILREGINIEQVKRQLILKASEQNKEFVESSPTSVNNDGFPQDGAPRNVGG